MFFLHLKHAILYCAGNCSSLARQWDFHHGVTVSFMIKFYDWHFGGVSWVESYSKLYYAPLTISLTQITPSGEFMSVFCDLLSEFLIILKYWSQKCFTIIGDARKLEKMDNMFIHRESFLNYWHSLRSLWGYNYCSSWYCFNIGDLVSQIYIFTQGYHTFESIIQIYWAATAKS